MVVAVLLTLLLGPGPQGGMDKVHPLLLEELAAADGPAAWVFFTDKGPAEVSAHLEELPSTLEWRALRRRAMRRTAPGLFDRRDLPVYAEYVRAVEEAGGVLRTTSSWLNAVSVQVDAGTVRRLAALPYVRKLQPVLRLQSTRCLPDATPAGASAAGFYGSAEDQLDQIRLIDLHALGYTGSGVLVGVLDTGFHRGNDAFHEPGHPLQVAGEYDFLNDDTDTGIEAGDLPNQHEHGTYILGTLGAYQPNVLVGGAYDASFLLAKVEDVGSEYLAEEDLFTSGLQWIEAQGGDVATSSLVIYNHYTQAQLDGLTSVMTLALNAATENGVHCFQAAANEGHDANPVTSNLLPPADSFLTVTVGAVDQNRVIAWFSSDGPSADGRVKPEVLARGVSTWTVNPNNDNALAAVSGTSAATPLAAGVAACLVQAHPEWTVGQMRAALFDSSDVAVATGSFDPLFVEGYGVLDAVGAHTLTPTCLDLEVDNLVAGQQADFTVTGGQPGAQVAVLWSTQAGSYAASAKGWCVDFQIQLPAAQPQSRIAVQGSFDLAGALASSLVVPAALSGRQLYFQAAQRDTCPDMCMSQVLDEVVQ